MPVVTRIDLRALAVALIAAAALAPAAPTAAHGIPGRASGVSVARGGLQHRAVRGRHPFESEFGYGFWPYGDAAPWPYPFPESGPDPDGAADLAAGPVPRATASVPAAQACVPAAVPGMPNVIYPSTGAPPVCN